MNSMQSSSETARDGAGPGSARSIRAFVTESIDLPGLSTFLDGLSHEGRVAAIGALGARDQARLFEAAKGFRPLDLAHFVPREVAPMHEVIHRGRNTLPAFNHFEKRFCRPSAEARELWGYNEQSMKWAVGPGYFVTREGDAGEVVIDYYETPPRKPEGWPEIISNKARLGRFVYHEMKDFMRGLSAHVSIGRAARRGSMMDAWFVLCRTP